MLDDDPFWSRVHRRHPDVDVVLLPAAVDQRQAPAALDVVRRAADHAVEGWHLLRPHALAAGATGRPSVRWGNGGPGDDRVALVVQQAVTGIGQDAGEELLRVAAAALGRAGWRLRPTTRDGLRVLDATDGLADVQAVAGPAATVLTVASAVLPVSAADREVVAAEVREVVASWA